ncbi:unnamed protein product [Medioppia subpectinata]|uniref:Uncharacterized protein n=1 Tax=Medioppia subpectinata TaxID=1979941 RepID=A0A7R9Q3C9_9ACAR|nr:unnamed protein product [Medioppia subpectinata]CAG2111145.1 unnamed protein product [Medioppia subpectinata]
MSEIFKNVSELEQFFRNLGIEYRFNCYYEKNGEGCHLLGEYMSKIEDDLIRSTKVFKDNCDNNGFARSCTQFGVNLLNGTGCAKDAKKAVEYLSRGCDLNDNEGCFYTGQLLSGADPQYLNRKAGCFYTGQLLSGADPQYTGTVEPDIKRSVKSLEKGCELTGNGAIAAECCFYLHSFYLFGKNGCEKDLPKALKYGIKGCDLDNVQSCNNLSQMYALGTGTAVDEVLAKKYRIKSIDMIEQMRNARHIDTQRT